MRKGWVYYQENLAGQLSETDAGYQFQYETSYLILKGASPISLTLPLQEAPFQDRVLFSFFDGLIPESFDNEELALTLNGKKRKFKSSDFLQFGKHIGLQTKQMENVHEKFHAWQGKWEELIHHSFLRPELRTQFNDLVRSRMNRLGGG